MITFDKEKHSLKAPVTLAFFFALLCLLGLNVPLNGDEGKTYLVHVDSTAWHLLVHFDWTHPHTLFSILSNTSMRIFGENEVAFRLPAFFAGVLSVFLIHRLGQSLWNSTTATIASLLMMGSYHHLVFSQHGRGYAITELLALAFVFGTIFLLDEKSNKIGAWVLIFSGIALCVTLPSNAFFLPGCGLAFLFVVYESKNPAVCLSWYRLGRKLLPFFILAALMIGYFLMIYDDLSLGLKREMAIFHPKGDTDSLVGRLQQVQAISWDLARPWGLWFYLPVLYGLWTLNRAQRIFFVSLLVTPTLLVVLSGIIGPPRIYIYALPFFTLLAAVGIDRGIRSLSHLVPRYFNKALPATLGLAFLIPSCLSYLSYNQYFLEKRGLPYATMAESREAFRYVQNQTTEHELVVISFDDMALRRSLEPLVAEKMLRIFQDGQLDGITFLGHRDIPVSKIASVTGWPTFPLPASMMKVIVDIGKVRGYRMNVNISTLFPLEADMKILRPPGQFRNPIISQTETHVHRFLGQQSLRVDKTIKGDRLSFSPFTLTRRIPSTGRSFILYGFAGKYKQRSKAGILGNKPKQLPFPLNYYFGVYREEGKNLAWEWIDPFFMLRHSKHKEPFKWHIIFMLIPLNDGLNEIKQALFLGEQTSYFDGIHGYLLAPIVEK
jgi:hypothetical protein